MPKKPTKRYRVKVSFVRRRKGRGDTYYIPQKGVVGKAGASVERHIYQYELPKLKFGKDGNGDKLAGVIEGIYERLAKRYGQGEIAAAAYTIQGRGAVDLDDDTGKPEWERKPFAVHRNYMSFSKSARDARERVRAFGDNDFSAMLQGRGSAHLASRSRPIFFAPRKIIISVIGNPGKKLTVMTKDAKAQQKRKAPKQLGGARKRVPNGKTVRKKRH